MVGWGGWRGGRRGRGLLGRRVLGRGGSTERSGGIALEEEHFEVDFALEVLQEHFVDFFEFFVSQPKREGSGFGVASGAVFVVADGF